MIDGREWSDGKLVASVVSSPEYVGIFIPILRVIFLSVDRLKLESLSSFSGNGVKIALGFLSAEGVYVPTASGVEATPGWKLTILLVLACRFQVGASSSEDEIPGSRFSLHSKFITFPFS